MKLTTNCSWQPYILDSWNYLKTFFFSQCISSGDCSKRRRILGEIVVENFFYTKFENFYNRPVFSSGRPSYSVMITRLVKAIFWTSENNWQPYFKIFKDTKEAELHLKNIRIYLAALICLIRMWKIHFARKMHTKNLATLFQSLLRY